MSRGRSETYPKLKGDYRRGIIVHLVRRDGARCFYCRRPFAAELAGVTLDHYIPHRLWPTNRARNLVLACEPCNVLKADALPWPLVWLLLALGEQQRAGLGVAA